MQIDKAGVERKYIGKKEKEERRKGRQGTQGDALVSE